MSVKSLIVLCLVGLLLSACDPRVVTLTTEHDCPRVVATVNAWIDENENGFWDVGEPPLPGVRFAPTGPCNMVSDPLGETWVSPDLCGNPPEIALNVCNVYVLNVPDNYRLTTPSEKNAGSENPLLFGFAPEYGKAIADYTTAIELNPDISDAYIDRARVYHTMSEYEKAIADYNTAIELASPQVVGTIYYARGEIYADLDKDEQALQDFEKCAETAPPWAGSLQQKAEKRIEELKAELAQ